MSQTADLIRCLTGDRLGVLAVSGGLLAVMSSSSCDRPPLGNGPPAGSTVTVSPKESGPTQSDATGAAMGPASAGRKLVYVVGQARSTGALIDPETGVAAPDGALGLRREVEVLQWRRRERRSTTQLAKGLPAELSAVDYEQEWSRDLIDAARHVPEYQNPTTMPLEPREFQPSRLRVGEYEVKNIPIEFRDWTRLNPRDARVGPAASAARPTSLPARSAAAPATAPTTAATRAAWTFSDEHVWRGDPKSARVGDYRISYEFLRPRDVSIVASLHDNMLVVDGPDVRAAEGVRSAEELGTVAESDGAPGTRVSRWVVYSILLALTFAVVALCVLRRRRNRALM